MGQQQLLLIILVTVVVGIDSIMALMIETDNKKLSDKTAVRQDFRKVAINP